MEPMTAPLQLSGLRGIRFRRWRALYDKRTPDDRNGFDKPALLHCGWRRMAPQPVWSGVDLRRLASGSPDTASQRPGLLR